MSLFLENLRFFWKRYPIFVAAVFLTFMSLTFQGARTIWDPDEGRYTAVALNMLSSGDFVLPKLNPVQDHLTKPPLTYWLIAASVKIFGKSEWSARFPYAVAFVLTGLLVLALARRFVPQKPWLALYIWGTSLFTVLAANVVSTDGFLVLFETLGIYAYWNWHERPRRANNALIGIAFGLAFLAKGPPALLPLMAVCAFQWWRGGGLKLRQHWPAFLCFAALAAPWFLWLMWARPELRAYFLGYELYGRVFTSDHDRNAQWYGALKVYLPVLFLAALPWLRASLLRDAMQWLRQRAWRVADHDGEQALFLVLWFVLPLVVFFVAKSRLFLYILPLAVPMSMLLARHFATRLDLQSTSTRIGLVVWPLFVVFLKGIVPIAPNYLPTKFNQDAYPIAQAVRQAWGHDPIARIFTVDNAARNGLLFYLGTPVQYVTVSQEALLRDGRIKDQQLVAAVCSASEPALLMTDQKAWIAPCMRGQAACPARIQVQPLGLARTQVIARARCIDT
jgi:4-amino-4-deoxy-L-arabinose transferase-like glycosyltransferase